MNKFLGLVYRIFGKKANPNILIKDAQETKVEQEVIEEVKCYVCMNVFKKSTRQLSNCCSDECRKTAQDNFTTKVQNTISNGKKCANCNCYFLNCFYVECSPDKREKVYFNENPHFCSGNCKKIYLTRKFCAHCKESYKEPYKVSCECCAASFEALKIDWKDYCSDSCRIKAINKTE